MEAIKQIHSCIWGAPLLLLFLGVGTYLTFILRGLQFRYLAYGLKLAFGGGEKRGQGDISHFESLMTALAATVGIGNIAGVATALSVGGPGALFWMWVTALLGMAIKYAEALLAVKYRKKDSRGEMLGGPMQYIEQGLGWRPLALLFALFGILASFGGGNMLQSNSVADILSTSLSVDPWISGTLIAGLLGISLIGGIKSVGKVASYLVPIMALLYLSGAVVVIAIHASNILPSLSAIFIAAFSPSALFGGFAGTGLMVALQVGVARGLMTSEAGLGTASIAAAAAKSDHPGRQAMVSMTGSFLATVVLCTLTGLALMVTEVGNLRGYEGSIEGASLTWFAFQSTLPLGGELVTLSLALFAFTTLLGWAYYGEKCFEYLFGEKMIPLFRLLFCIVAFFGATLKLELVWALTDVTNALMAFPNLIALPALSAVLLKETKAFLLIREKELLNS